ncbi:flagellar biosynthesis protein FlhB [Thiovibrio frasassiensis]|uniref:Flagellar biosynthetic protein FlhB n=1 Tax=Thiovibrio frasassiensis TaxID=2984131 RepID=A0A9X4RKA0_9BACT|nr:flagellar biosynthesis protein FlhB [Thiovibrio frasassiensis]MDG4474861.1 flagellar biosynthesis protein FlhB [Thiovibrio frasassiensis]
MADESSGQEKSEAPTSRRIQEAREKGDVAKSMEVPSAAVLLAGLLTLYYSSDFMLGQFLLLLRYYLGNLHTITITSSNMTVLTRESMLQTVLIVAPVMGAIFIAALASNYAQVGFLFTTEKLMPKFDKIDPIQGFSRLFSKQTLANVVKSVGKLLIIGYVSYAEIQKALPGILPLMDQEPMPILAFMCKIAFWIFLKSALIIAILAAADYAFQRWQFMEKMKMTKQEIKDEAKQTEGDPHVKGRIRAIQMQMARQRMMAEVPKADVVITNPTRLAIALRYDALAMVAPTVLAKGAGVIAQNIRKIAEEHAIPLVEDKPLAQALYKSTGLNETIPENLFQTVAEVLAYVYSLKRKRA